VYDFASGEIRQITNGEGSNESPSFAPNGRHLAFTSTRAGGKVQVFTISRDGKDVRQITRVGNNYTPDWSH
jgi:TolB protein